MFTELIVGTRTVRIHLVFGYSILSSAYLAADDSARRPETWVGTWRLVGDLYHDLGTTGRAALWALTAAMLGSLLCNLLLDRLLDRLTEANFDWDNFIGEARNRVVAYEEYEVTNPSPTSSSQAPRNDKKHIVPSLHWAGYLEDEVEERKRRRGEVRFRVAVGIATFPPDLVLACRGGWLWLIGMTPGALIIVDAWQVGRGQARIIIESRLRANRQDLERAQRSESLSTEREAQYRAGLWPEGIDKSKQAEALVQATEASAKAREEAVTIQARINQLESAKRRPLAALKEDSAFGAPTGLRYRVGRRMREEPDTWT